MTLSNSSGKIRSCLISAFTACWSPYFLLMIMNSFDLIHNYLLIRVTSSLCYMNSLANPLIYWLFATNFFLRCRWAWDEPGRSSSISRFDLDKTGAGIMWIVRHRIPLHVVPSRNHVTVLPVPNILRVDRMNTIVQTPMRVLLPVVNRIIVHPRVFHHVPVNILFNIRILNRHFSMVMPLNIERDEIAKDKTAVLLFCFVSLSYM
jgi:hypothetical protein